MTGKGKSELAGSACSPLHPHLHVQVSSGIQQHLHHRLVPADTGVHQGGHALRWLKPETETFTRWPWSVGKHVGGLISVCAAQTVAGQKS